MPSFNFTATKPITLLIAWAILSLLLVWMATYAPGFAYGIALVIFFTVLIQYQRTV